MHIVRTKTHLLEETLANGCAELLMSNVVEEFTSTDIFLNNYRNWCFTSITMLSDDIFVKIVKLYNIILVHIVDSTHFLFQ